MFSAGYENDEVKLSCTVWFIFLIVAGIRKNKKPNTNQETKMKNKEQLKANKF